jgi:hypothetical protein
VGKENDSAARHPPRYWPSIQTQTDRGLDPPAARHQAFPGTLVLSLALAPNGEVLLKTAERKNALRRHFYVFNKDKGAGLLNYLPGNPKIGLPVE